MTQALLFTDAEAAYAFIRQHLAGQAWYWLTNWVLCDASLPIPTDSALRIETHEGSQSIIGRLYQKRRHETIHPVEAPAASTSTAVGA
jgi:hypothetical protein